MRWGSAVVGLALIGFAIILFTGWTPWAWGSEERRERISAETVRLDVGESDVVIRAGDVERIDLVARIRSWWTSPDQGWERDGDTLVLADCGLRCSVDYELVVPPGTRVEGRTGSGDVQVSGVSSVALDLGSGDLEVRDVSGAVEAKTGSGDVLLERVEGRSTVRTTSGSIRSSALRGPAEVETTSGDIRLELSRPQDVRAETTSGDLTITVPDGSYRIDTSGDRDDDEVEVVDDPDGRYRLDLSTTSGDIAVREG